MKYFKKRRKYDNYEPLLKKKRKLYIKKRKQKEPYSQLIKIIINCILFIMSILILGKKKIFSKKKLVKTKVAMCTLAKRENRYLKYFIEFYFKLGYNHIYFYDHNEIGDEAITDLDIVKEGIKNGCISVIDYKIRKADYQASSYYDCYDKYIIYILI